MSALRGLGRKLRALASDALKLFYSNLADFFTDELPSAISKTTQFLQKAEPNWMDMYRSVLQEIADDPPGEENPDNPLPALAGVGALLAGVAVLQPALQVYAAKVTANAMTQIQWAAQKPLVPDQTKVQIEASLPYIPAQTKAQVEASLPFIPQQTEAQIRAQLPFVKDQLQAQLDATRDVRPQGLQLQAAGELVARGLMNENQAEELVGRAGVPAGLVNLFAKIGQQYLTGQQYVDAYRRRIIDGETFTEKMRLLGYADDDIETLRKQLQFYPPPTDLITWQAREVYEEDAVQKYGLEEELDRLDREPFYRGGLDDEQIRNYWVAHWQHPPFNQIAEMFLRDILINPEDRDRIVPGSPEWIELRKRAEEEVYEWYRLVEIPPYWRDKLTRMLYQPYTRVDIRRMEDLAVVSETEVLRNYLDLGYDLQHAQKLTLWTRIANKVPDLIARYKNGYISADDVLRELQELGMPADRAQELFETKIQKEGKGARLAKEKDLTLKQIYDAVKRKAISRDEGKTLVKRLGYDDQEAEYLLLTYVDWAGSPETFSEFQQGVEAFRAATGLDAKAIPARLIELERKLAELRKKQANLESIKAPQAEQDRLGAEIATLEYHIKTLRNSI